MKVYYTNVFIQLEEAEQPGMEGVKDKQPDVFTC